MVDDLATGYEHSRYFSAEKTGSPKYKGTVRDLSILQSQDNSFPSLPTATMDGSRYYSIK